MPRREYATTRRHRPGRLALAAIAILGLAQTLAAQTTTINQFKGFARNRWFIMNTGWDAPPLRGRATTPYLNATSEMVEFFLQDDTGGIRVRGAEGGYFLSRIAGYAAADAITGREVRVEYFVRLVEEHGELIAELEDPEFSLFPTVNVPPALPAAVPLTIPQLLSRAFDGRLATLTNVASVVSVVWPPRQDSQAGEVTDGAHTARLYIDKDTPLSGATMPPPGVAYDVTGVVVSGSALTPGLRMLLPRSLGDFNVPEIPNVAPTIVAPERVLGTPGGATVAFEVHGFDANPQDALTFAVANAPAGATFVAIAPRIWRFAWAPKVGDDGARRLTFSVADRAFTAYADTVLDIRRLSGGPDHPWINELHYDDTGLTDTNEGFELAGRAGIDLANYVVYTYTNAVPNAPAYVQAGPIALTGTIPNETGNGYGAVWFPRPGLSNAGGGTALRTAGLALVQVAPTNALIQFLSYEGAFTAANGPAAGALAFDVGVAEDNATPIGHALHLIGAAALPDIQYENFFWIGPAPASPGSINGGQTFGGVGGRATVALGRPNATPMLPHPGQPFDVVVAYTRSYSATGLSGTLFYTTDGWATTNTLAMLRTEPGTPAGTFRTASPIPGQPIGTSVAFFVSVAYGGHAAASPTRSATVALTIRKAIAFQGFEGAATDTWRYTARPNGGTVRTTTTHRVEGVQSLRISGPATQQEAPYVEFHNRFLTGYTNVNVTVAYAGQAIDSGDWLTLSFSYDGGTTWPTNVVLARGFANVNFGFDETLGSIPHPWTQPSNPYVHPVPAGVNQITVRVQHRGNADSSHLQDFYYLDAVSLSAASGALLALPPAFDPVGTNWFAEATRTNDFTVAAHDPNGGVVGLALQSALPPGATFTAVTNDAFTIGTLRFIPSANFVGHQYPLRFAATDADGTTTLAATVTVTPRFTGYRWNFDDGTRQGWSQVAYAGSPIPLWDWDVYPDFAGTPLHSGPGIGAAGSTHYAGVNAFNATNPEAVDLWWVSPIIDCRHMQTPRLAFMAWHNFGGSNLVAYATTNLHAAVEHAGWQVLPVTWPTTARSWTFCQTTLAGWTNAPFRVAFRYIADGTSGGSRCWAVDAITVDDAAVEAPPPPPDGDLGIGPLIISEYGEGSGHNKYLELFNLAATNVNLAAYALRIERNGVGGYSDTLNLSGTLAPRSTYVIVRDQASDALRQMANLSTSSQVVNFNGNDAIGLFYQGVVADAVGVLGQAADWGVDLRLIRKPSVTAPRRVYAPSEWLVGNRDDWSDVGRHTTDGSPALPAAPTGLAVSNLAVTGFTLAWNAVAGANGYRVDVATNAAFTGILSGYHGLFVAGTSISVADLAPETAYWARVRAVSGALQSDSSTAVTATTRPALLLLSEYGEGGANNNMYIELHNPHPVPVALARYAIRKRSSTLVGYGVALPLSGTLAPGATYVIAHAAASATLRARASLVTAADALNFNGRHAVALFRDGAALDVIGWPGVTWGADKTFVRRIAITQPTATYTPTEWIELPADDWSNVGGFTDPSGSGTPARRPVLGGIALSPTGAVVTFAVLPAREAGVTYALQRAATAGAGPSGWTRLTAPMEPLDAATARFTDPAPPPTNAFYRVEAIR